MMSDVRGQVVARLRGRILRGVQAGLLRPGDRLPPSREVASELEVDYRVVLDAYRVLEAEGVVEMRARGGIYVAAGRNESAVASPSAAWLAEVLAQGIGREIPIVQLHEWLRRAVETLRLRVLVVQRTSDQVAGLCRELTDYYGLLATGLEGERIESLGEPPPEVRSTDLILTSAPFETKLRPMAERLGKRLIVAEVRPDLIGEEWRLLLRQKVYVVVNDERFMEMVQSFFAGTPGRENLIPIVLGRDPLEQIPDDAPVYLTASAREALGNQAIRGRILPPPRFLSPASAQELVRVIVEMNLRAVAAMGS